MEGHLLGINNNMFFTSVYIQLTSLKILNSERETEKSIYNSHTSHDVISHTVKPVKEHNPWKSLQNPLKLSETFKDKKER